jgi:hypothetical protein
MPACKVLKKHVAGGKTINTLMIETGYEAVDVDVPRVSVRCPFAAAYKEEKAAPAWHWDDAEYNDHRGRRVTTDS